MTKRKQLPKQESSKETLADSLEAFRQQKQLQKELLLNAVKPDQIVQKQLIINAYEGRPIKEAKHDKKFSGDIIDLIGKWRVYSGAIKDLDPEGNIITAEYIFLANHYGDLTDLELKHLIDLYTKHEFHEIQYFDYPNFCAAFMSKVILAFFKYKNDRLEEIIKKAKGWKLASPPAGPEVHAESMREMLEMIHGVIHNPQSNIYLYRGIINITYGYLKGIKKINFTPESNEKARRFAQEKDPKDVDLFGRYFYLREVFEKNGLEAVIEYIKLEHFTEKIDQNGSTSDKNSGTAAKPRHRARNRN